MRADEALQVSEAAEILGVAFDASPEEVRAAHRRAVKRHHPDRTPDDPGAADRFRRVQAAYELLSAPFGRDRLAALDRARAFVASGAVTGAEELRVNGVAGWAYQIAAGPLECRFFTFYDPDEDRFAALVVDVADRGQVFVPADLVGGREVPETESGRCTELAQAHEASLRWFARLAWDNGLVGPAVPRPGTHLGRWAPDEALRLCRLLGIAVTGQVQDRIDQEVEFLVTHAKEHGDRVEDVVGYLRSMIDSLM